MREVLDRIAAGQVPDERRQAVVRANRAALNRPPFVLQDMPGDFRLPLLSEAYVEPSFRVFQMDAADLARESWWCDHSVRNDLGMFLVNYFTSQWATGVPLLVLGMPGSGKSLLTQALAGMLSPSDFLAVRVILRNVPGDADVQAQIEYSIRAATGESLEWSQLARSAVGALSLVMFDGFNELLATGVSQPHYLEKVAEFQRREADQGRSVAALVTSRTVEADCAKAVPGMLGLMLEPFRDAQIAQWLNAWNSVNSAALRAAGRLPLSAETVLAQGEVASQPLLLLMLAIYEAKTNALQGSNVSLSAEWLDTALTCVSAVTAPELAVSELTREIMQALGNT
jgi:hypothetical protein